MKSLSRVQLLATPWTAAYQAPPSMGFSRQEYWSGLPLPSLTIVDYQSLNHDRILGNVQNTSKLSKKPGVSGWGAVGRMKRIGNSLILRVSERKNLQALMKSQTLSISVKDPEGVWARHGLLQTLFNCILFCQLFVLSPTCLEICDAFGRRKFLCGSRDNEQTYWKIVDKCTHLAFYWLSS